MSYKILPHSLGRVEVSPGLSSTEAKELAANKEVTVIQFSKPLAEKDFDNLAQYVFNKRNDIQFRVYGHYSIECDLSFIKKFPTLKKFSADCIIDSKNEDYISSLKDVEDLHVGIFGLTSFDFLDGVNPNLRKLMIGNTFSKKPSIRTLSRFKNLQFLYNEGQTNGVEAINDLISLEKIVLRSITVPNMDFILGLKNLWSIDIKLGGTKNFSALKNFPGVKYLELWQINKLADISFISEMPDLQNLFIQSLRNVEALPNFKNSHKLRRVSLENLKGLKDISSLKDAPALEEFIYAHAQNQSPKNLTAILENESIKQILIRFGSVNKNNSFDEIIKQSGKQIYTRHDFEYK